MEDPVTTVIGDASNGVEIVLAIIGVMGVLRMGYLTGKLIVRAASILEATERGEKVC